MKKKLAKSTKLKGAAKKTGKERLQTRSKKLADPFLSASLAQNIWPQERDYMTRPDRYKYVRKLIKTKGCVFCEALQKGVSSESLVLYRDAQSMVMLNKYPYNSGHLLVLPARHCGQLLDLSEDEYFAVQRQLRRAAQAVIECYDCEGFNMGLNHGKVAGAGIPDHLHWHVIPRWYGDTNFFPVIAETKVLVQTLEQSYDRLKTFFKE